MVRNLYHRLAARLRAVCASEEGSAMVEYGLLIALISLGALVAIQALGTNISGVLTTIAGALTP